MKCLGPRLGRSTGKSCHPHFQRPEGGSQTCAYELARWALLMYYTWFSLITSSVLHDSYFDTLSLLRVLDRLLLLAQTLLS